MSPDSGVAAPLLHGGDLGAARSAFPGAPEPFLDLSTGINPVGYPLTELAPEVFARLPEPQALALLTAVAAGYYGAPSPDCVVAAPGMQSLLPHLMGLVPRGRAVILGPTYGEHARVAAGAGHRINAASSIAQAPRAGLTIVVNPNNPDGRLIAKADLLAFVARRRGLCVIDEAFMDTVATDQSLGAEVGRVGVVVLRSFGKFFGLAGLRLSFAIAAPAIASRLRAALGPWPVSGPAIAIGTAALEDHAWIALTRTLLAAQAARLDQQLRQAGFAIMGGTTLFRLVRTPRASDWYQRLGTAGILVRRFPEQADQLRFGLPADEAAWQRLRAVLVDGS